MYIQTVFFDNVQRCVRLMATAAAQQQPFPLAGAVQAPGENQGAVKLTVQVDVAHKRPYPRAGGGKRSRGMYRFGFSTVSNIGGQAVVRADAAIGGNLITTVSAGTGAR